MQVFHPGQLEHPRHGVYSFPPGSLPLSRVSASAEGEPGRLWADSRGRRFLRTGKAYLKKNGLKIHVELRT